MNALLEVKKSIEVLRPEIKRALPAHISVDKFLRAAHTAAMTTPGIDKADRNSLFEACTKAAQDGLVIDGKEAALVVYNVKDGNGWIKKAQYQPMVQGLLKKLRQSGQLKKITAQVVYEKDSFSYNPAMDDAPNHSADWFADRGEAVGVYAVAILKDDSFVVEIMNKSEVEAIRSRSRSKDSGPWKTDTAEMWRKTVIKRICKYLPSSSDIDGLIEVDNEEYILQELNHDDSLCEAIKEDAPNVKKETKAAKAVKEQENVVDVEAEDAEFEPLDDDDIPL